MYDVSTLYVEWQNNLTLDTLVIEVKRLIFGQLWQYLHFAKSIHFFHISNKRFLIFVYMKHFWVGHLFQEEFENAREVISLFVCLFDGV